MRNNINIIINGMGGQGIVLCGEIIAKAVHNSNPKAYVAQNQNYSAQARGGFSQSTVKLSYQPILYPLIDEADILVYTGEEGFKTKSRINKKGLIIADKGLMIEKFYPHNQIIYIPLRQTINKLGSMSQINLLLLGILERYLGAYISYRDLKQEINSHFKGVLLQENMKVLEMGRNLIPD